MKIGMISCWYPYVGISDYTDELIQHLPPKFKKEIEVISGNCYCQLRVGSRPRSKCHWYSPALNKISKIFGRFRYIVNGILWSLWLYVQTRKTEVIHYQLCSGYFGLQTLLFYLFLPKRNKIIVTFHEFKFKRIKSKFKQKLLSKIDTVIIHCKFSKERLTYFFPYLRHKARIIHHGVRIPKFKDKAREEITFFGAPTRLRGGLYLLEAMRILKKRKKPIFLNIYGFGTKDEKETFQTYIKKLSLEENISMHGILNNKLFYQKLQESKLVILPRLESHASGILLKAMASGTPIISTNVGGIPEYLADGGIVVPIKNPTQLADAIQKLEKNELLRQEKGRIGRERAKNLFSWNKIGFKTSEVYKNLVGKDNLKPRKLKVIFISHMYPPDYMGGGEIYCSYTAEELIRRGNIVKILTRASSFKAPNYAERILHFRYKASAGKTPINHLRELFFNFYNFIVAIRYLKNEKPDLVAMWYPHGITISPLLAADLLKIPFVIHAGSLWPWEGLLKHKLLLRNSKRIFAVNKHIKDKLIDMEINQENIKLVLGGVDTSVFKKIQLRKKETIVLFVGQLLWSKGVHILIRAFLKLIKSFKNVKLIVIGSGREKYERYLKKIAGNQNNIIFLGKIPHHELVKHYNQAYILVLPSLIQEGLPLVILEAMACGLPVIASESAGVSDIARNGKTGFIFSRNDVNELCEKIQVLLENPELWNSFSKNCEKLAREEYDWKSVTRIIENEYRKILEE